MERKVLQKLIAVVLVLCMTATNFIFVAANAVYAISNKAELEDGKIVFEAYYKGEDENNQTVKTSTKTANISEGDSLFISLLVGQGKLQNAKVKIDNANFKIDEEKIDKTIINGISSNGLTKEISLKEISYNDCNGEAIEIEIPIKFEEASTIDTSYFDMENNITLSGKFLNSSENGKDIQSDGIKTTLKWNELGNIHSTYTPNVEKIIYLENATLVQVSVSSTFDDKYFPKETEILTFNLPKVEGVTPTYTMLVNGDKVSNTDITTPAGSEEISYTNNFVKDGKITWNKAGDVYKIIYVYEGITELADPIEFTPSIQQKLFNREIIEKKQLSAGLNQEKGTIASVTANATSSDVYKGYMYANSNDTEYKETYNMEISYVDGITAELNLKEDNFKTEGENLSTNNNTEYKEIVLNRANIQKVLGTTGSIKITPENTQLGTITLDKETSTDENGNIVISYDKIKNSHNVKIEVINAENEGTIKIDVTKIIKGNAGYDRDVITTIKAIETTVASKTNLDKENNESNATITTQLNETTTEATLTMNNNNSLSTISTNNVEFIATLKTGTMDTDLLKDPTIKIQLPEEVTDIKINSSSALYAEEELTINSAEALVEEKAILVKLDGEQYSHKNNFIDGIKITINADITLNTEATSRNAEISMTYTNENSAQKEYTKTIPVAIMAPEVQTTGTENNEDTNTTKPEEVEPEGTQVNNEKLVVNVAAVSGNKELKNNESVFENQTIRYTYTITNTSNEDVADVKITANHENANVFEDVTKTQMNTAKPEENINFIYEEETENQTIEKQIGIIKAGKTKQVAYQVRVQEDAQNTKATATISGTGIENIVYEMTNNVNKADVKLELYNNRSKQYPIQKDVIIPNIIKVTNKTEELMEDVLVNVIIPKEFEYYNLSEIENKNDYTIVSNSNNVLTFKINKIASKNAKIYQLALKMIDENPSSSSVQLKYFVNQNENIYYSNDLELLLTKQNKSVIDATFAPNITEETVKTGDALVYTLTLKNNGNVEDRLIVKEIIPEAAVITNAYIQANGENSVIEDTQDNQIIETIFIKPEEEKQLVVETQIDESKTGKEEITANAVVTGNYLDETIEKEIAHKLQANIKPADEEQENPTTPEPTEPTNLDEPTTPGTLDTKQTISGIVWLDSNKNGIRESSEKRIPGIKVILANITTQKYVTDEKGNILELTTNENGEYKFENISDGSYMVVFAFDNTKYRNTEYHATSATNATNSDIISSKLLTNNEETKYGVTDTLVLKENSLENIDAGLIENEIFDLSINKYVNKVTVQNSSGTTLKEYNKEKLAKLEIDSKNLTGSTLLVEYQIAVKNEGEIAGYANEIIDYMPKDLTFSSELNKDWYLSTDGNLHTTTLSKELIEPGETKTIKVILTKTMTENNTGLTSNKAEIVKSSNELLIPDSNANQNSSTAELIVSIRTGVETTIGIIITLIAIATTGIIVYARKRKEASHE